MEWDYKKVCASDGDYWNKMPNQLELLKKYYPIGMMMNIYYGYSDSSLPIKAEIIEHVENRSHKDAFILKIKCVKYGNTQVIHPGYYTPDVQYLRDRKLKELGI